MELRWIGKSWRFPQPLIPDVRGQDETLSRVTEIHRLPRHSVDV